MKIKLRSKWKENFSLPFSQKNTRKFPMAGKREKQLEGFLSRREKQESVRGCRLKTLP